MPSKKEIFNDNSDITSNSKQIALLKQHFPNCFDKEGNFLTHKIEELLGDAGVELSQESYSLHWLGKSYARLLANENPRTLLKEEKTHNSKESNKKSENLLIKGDNLEVLKHLTNAYSQSIKMIYIDPPYNTGSDGFVYNDKREFTVSHLSKLAGVDVDEAQRILDFTSSKSNSHSAWLTFMYPRLYIARELLRDDGVIFISIDDNEVAQLKLLCDEIFGEENFVEEFIWKNGRTSSSIFTNEHEYILCYAKVVENIDFISYTGEDSLITDRCVKPISKKNPAVDILFKKGIKFNSEDKIFPSHFGNKEKIEIIDGIFECKDGLLRSDVIIRAGWTMKDMIERWLQKEEVIDLKGQKVTEFYFKSNGVLQYIKERGTIHPKTIIQDFTTKQGTVEVTSLFKSKVFSYPKPIKLIQFLMLLTNKNDTILDFFAGSGTTAHAVMALNKEDGGNRKFITVQIAEETDEKSEAYKAGYKTIFDITKARIEKASEKLEDRSGFKIYETTPIFEGYLDDIEELDVDTTLFDGRSLDSEELEQLLTTWRVDDGMRLSDEIKVVDLAGYKAYWGVDSIYFMESGFTTDVLKAFIAKLDNDPTFEPSKLVLFGYNFESRYQREVTEALRNYTNKKEIELDMLIRY